jgi:16S rRNA (guanine1207-N2)-methyltransferase
MVANRHLPYEATLNECFRNVDMIGGNGAFKVFHANRPHR